MDRTAIEELAAGSLGTTTIESKPPASGLVVQGADSDVLDAKEAAALAHALPDGRCDEVENAGHTVQGDNPHAFVAELLGFLRGALSPS
jgi:pimeloyl-ACP methyl ester carboxylesterase